VQLLAVYFLPFIAIAEVYSGADQEKMTHTRGITRNITYSAFQ
jgi:hypothetical protein